MQCEFSNGATWNVTDAGALEERVRSVSSGDHIILSSESAFIQMARSAGGVDVQWGDGSNLYECDDTVSLDDAAALFSSFYQGDDRWRTMVAWGGGDAVGGAASRGGGIFQGAGAATPGDGSGQNARDGSAPGGGKGLAEQLVDDAAGMLKRKAKRALRNGLRRFLG